VLTRWKFFAQVCQYVAPQAKTLGVKNHWRKSKQRHLNDVSCHSEQYDCCASLRVVASFRKDMIESDNYNERKMKQNI
jgi:hypothetical protein